MFTFFKAYYCQENVVGIVICAITGGSAKAKRTLNINGQTGRITVKKKMKKGTYKINVAVTAAGNDQYNAGSKTVKVFVKVR